MEDYVESIIRTSNWRTLMANLSDHLSDHVLRSHICYVDCLEMDILSISTCRSCVLLLIDSKSLTRNSTWFLQPNSLSNLGSPKISTMSKDLALYISSHSIPSNRLFLFKERRSGKRSTISLWLGIFFMGFDVDNCVLRRWDTHIHWLDEDIDVCHSVKQCMLGDDINPLTNSVTNSYLPLPLLKSSLYSRITGTSFTFNGDKKDGPWNLLPSSRCGLEIQVHLPQNLLLTWSCQMNKCSHPEANCIRFDGFMDDLPFTLFSTYADPLGLSM